MNAEIKSPVLVIEDDFMLGLLYEATLDDPATGFAPVIKPTPKEGLQYFEANQGRIHLVIVDRDLPEMKGEIVAERIRQITGKEVDPYIIMITGSESVLLDPRRVFAMGVNEVVSKPFSPKELVAKLTQVNQRFQIP